MTLFITAASVYGAGVEKCDKENPCPANNSIKKKLPPADCTGGELETKIAKQKGQLDPWVGKYCMSFFTKTRSVKTVGKDRFSIALKWLAFDADDVRQPDMSYDDLPGGDSYRRDTLTTCMKYGWAEDHHIAVGIPYAINNYDRPTMTNHSRGLGNMFIFEKWNFLRETNDFPGMSVDIWYYFPTGDAERKLGSEDASFKLTGSVSKAWKDFSVHFNPGYRWSTSQGPDIGEINAGVFWTPTKTFWPAMEWNYTDKENAGHKHEIVPGFVWKFQKGASFKLGFVVDVESTMKYRDRLGLVAKLFYTF